MKKLYFLTRKTSYANKSLLRVVKSAGLAFAFILLIQSAFGQVSIKWTGLFGTSAIDTRNWEPQLAVQGNILVIDSAKKFTNLPTFDGVANMSVARLTLSATSRFNVNMATPSLQFMNNDGSNTYLPHDMIINITQGEFYNRKNFYLEDSLAIVNISGNGSVRTGSFWGMSKLGTKRGGFVNISGNGFMIADVWPDRFCDVDAKKGVITIIDNGYLDLKGDATTVTNIIKTAITRNQIKTSADRDIVMQYNAVTNRTKLYTRLKMAFIVEPGTTQKILANNPGTDISVVQNDGWKSMVSFKWKLTKTSGSGYTYIANATNDKLVPSFVNPGTYFVVCEGNNGTTTVLSNEIQFVVSSDIVHLTPNGRQLLKKKQEGYMITVTEDKTATSREWKYTTTTGSNYISFSPSQTGAEYTPLFNTTGEYFVLCESQIGGIANPSSEIQISVVDTTTSKDIFWKGTTNSDVSNMTNWDPYAKIFNNVLTINPGYTNAPVLSAPGRHNIYGLNVNANASLTIDFPSMNDTLYRGSDIYQNGDLFVKGGVFYIKGRLRLESATPSITVTGGKLIMTTDFIVGTSTGSAGAKFIEISGNGIIDAGEQIWRYATDTTKSAITIKGNGKLIVHGLAGTHGDYRGGIQTAIAKNRIKTIQGRELVIEYPNYLASGDTVTVVYSKDLAAFSIQPAEIQYLAVNEASAALSTVNNSAVTANQWKYSKTSGKDYLAFVPAITTATATPSFATAGSYYVVCEGTTTDGTVVSNEVNLVIVGVSINPAANQTIEVKASGAKLTVTETVAATSKEWKYSSASGSGYVSFLPKRTSADLTPVFINAGTYYVVCESVVGGKTFRSNEVKIIVNYPTAVVDLNADAFSVYPNPANKDFYIDAKMYSNYKVKVIDIQGRIIQENVFNNASGRQKLTIAKQGIYFVKIETDKSVHTKCIIIK